MAGRRAIRSSNFRFDSSLLPPPFDTMVNPPNKPTSKRSASKYKYSSGSKKARREARNDKRRSPPTMGSNVSKDTRKSSGTDDLEPQRPPRMKEVNEELEEEGLKPLTELDMRAAVKVAYLVEFKRPAKELWNDRDDGIVGILHRRLGMDTRTIATILERIESGEGIERRQGSGRPLKLKKDNKGLRCAAIALNAGLGPGMATELCNFINREANPDMPDDEFKSKLQVVPNTLLNNLKAYTDVLAEAVQRDKTGTYDENSFWAWMRKHFASQVLFMIELGKKVDNGEMTYADCIKDHNVPPLFVDALAQWDESNTTSKMSGGSSSTMNKMQYRVSLNEKGELVGLGSNGAMPEKRVQKVPKKESSAAGMYGVAVPIIGGVKKPQFLETLNYTTVTVCAPKIWDPAFQKKINQFKGIKSRTSPWYEFRNAENPWEARYGNEINPETGRKMWEDEIRKAPGLCKLM